MAKKPKKEVKLGKQASNAFDAVNTTADLPVVMEDKEAPEPFKTVDIPKPRTITVAELLSNVYK